MTIAHPSAARTVLIADDEPLTRHLLNLVLSQHRFTVTGAATAAEALELCRRDQPAIVLIDADFSAPESGIGLLAELRAAHPGVAICLESGGNKYGEEELERLGVAAFFGKPFLIDQLVQVLNFLCRHHR